MPPKDPAKRYTFNGGVNEYGETYAQVFGGGSVPGGTGTNIPPVPPTGTAPVSTVPILPVGQIYGEDPELTKARNELGGQFKTAATGAIDENQIRQQALAQIQAEIDATNTIYAEKLRQAKIQGVSRLGSGTAVQARRGLIGSDFGGAITDNINTDNRAIEGGIEAEKMARINQLLTGAKTAATAEIAAKTAAKQQGLDNYIKFLNDSASRKTVNAGAAAKALLAAGQDIATLDENTLSQVLNGYGITKDQLTSSFAEQKAAAEAAQAEAAAKKAKADAEIAKTNAETEKLKNPTQTGIIGEYEYAKKNGYTGTFSQYQNEDANRKAVATKIAGGTKPEKLTATERQALIGQTLIAQQGEDFKVSPEDWRAALNDWVSVGGGTAASFKERYGHLINTQYGTYQ